jgi:predicted DNA-binding transcriptional regulator AlpA
MESTVTDNTSHTIEHFCADEQMSRSQFYRLKRQGKAPRLYFIGNRPRISPEARREWRQAREAEAAARSEGA